MIMVELIGKKVVLKEITDKAAEQTFRGHSCFTIEGK